MSYRIKSWDMGHLDYQGKPKYWTWHQVKKRIGRCDFYFPFEVETKWYANKICRQLNDDYNCAFFLFEVVEM